MAEYTGLNNAIGVYIEELMSIPLLDMLEGYHTDSNVVFIDGVRYLTSKEIVVNRLLLESTNIYNLKIPIKVSYSVDNHYTNGYFTKGTMLSLFSAVFKDIVITYPDMEYDNFFKTLQEINGDMYSIIAHHYGEYASSIQIEDFLEIQNNKEILKAIDVVEKENTYTNVKKAYSVVDSVMRLPEYSHNALATGYVCGAYNKSQVHKLIGPAGARTELSGRMYTHMIPNSITQGLKTTLDMYQEQRSGAKAMHVSGAAIAGSEYGGRIIGLVTQRVHKLIRGDCGSTDYIDWYVRPADDINNSDLVSLSGTRYVLPDGTLGTINIKDKHLEGIIIKIRNPLKCKLPNKAHLCSTCMGALSNQIFGHTNVGLLSATIPISTLTSGMLSTKHDSGNVSGNELKLCSNGEKLFTIKSGNVMCFIAGKLKQRYTKYTLIVNQRFMSGFKSINSSTNTDLLNPLRVSRVESVIIEVLDSTTGVIETYDINTHNASFTLVFIRYILDTGYTLDQFDRFHIDLSGWHTTAGVLIKPNMEFSYTTISKAMKSLLVSSKTSKHTPIGMLQAIFDLLNNTKMSTNIAWVSIMVYAFIMENKENHLLARFTDEEAAAVGNISKILTQSSIGVSLGWERIDSVVYGHSVYDASRDLETSPMDMYLDPYNTARELRPQAW